MIADLLAYRHHPGGPTTEEVLVDLASSWAGGAHRGAYRIGNSMSLTEVEVIRGGEWVTVLHLPGHSTWRDNLAATAASVHTRLLGMIR